MRRHFQPGRLVEIDAELALNILAQRQKTFIGSEAIIFIMLTTINKNRQKILTAHFRSINNVNGD